MKNVWTKDLLSKDVGEKVSLKGWISGKRCMGRIVFLDINDSTGTIQTVIEKKNVTKKIFDLVLQTPPESAIEVGGSMRRNKNVMEIYARSFKVIGKATLQLSPRPRSNFDIFGQKHTKQVLDYRHVYLRNAKLMAVLKFRSKLMQIIREWFIKNKFIEFDAPILTPAPLYDNSTAIPVTIHGERIFLTQCAGFYLEAAAHALERVFNMGPSFRGEESRSNRHLIEYWHIKAELVFGNIEDIISLVEKMLKEITIECSNSCKEIMSILETHLCTDSTKSPFPRISYEDAIKHLQTKGFKTHFGKGIGVKEEKELSKIYTNTPFWLVGIPRIIEPFPYSINAIDPRITVVADLIASNGCGELLGVAEKIYDPEMLNERLREKGKFDDPRYQFVKDIHQTGCVPHIAFGMGLERLIRWLLNLPHVRDAIPFPRVVRRNIKP